MSTRKPDPERAGAIFEALADPTRRTLMRSVAEDGPVTATQLAAKLPISRQAVAKHLDLLEAVGLVRGERQGREIRFQLTPEPLDDAVAWMDQVGGSWDQRLAALRRRIDTRRSS